MDPNVAEQHDASPEAENELPSCESCRKRKLKCTRQLPSCAHCMRLEISCVYEQRRNKPGLKSGAVESLNRRLEIVEKAVLGRHHQTPQPEQWPDQSQPSHVPVLGILTTLAQELHKLNSSITSSGATLTPSGPPTTVDVFASSEQSRKRRRAEYANEQWHLPTASGECASAGEQPEGLPCYQLRGEVLDEVLDVYFENVQPWIPMVHEATFRPRVRTQEGRRRHSLVLHAMCVAALKLAKHDGQPLPDRYVASETERSKRIVLLGAMSGISIGNGNHDKAWPIVGSITRTVENIQLSVETEGRQTRSAALRPPSLPIAVDWVEEEERRRVFWNVFILDRFCAVSTGWTSSNTSLTAADVCRRLPVCGGLWYSKEPATTPYFGIWDSSSAKIGRSITYLPAHYPGPQPRAISPGATALGQGATPTDSRARSMPFIDMTNVGAFAYYIESIESLSRIISYFLHQQVDFGDRAQVSDWLTRFKELDLRLVHWKLHLPHQWKDSGVSRECLPGIMDPNMTVANATHNTSMILLHHPIAYPGTHLAGITLPHAYSAETCRSAAIETAVIAKNFLASGPADRPVTPQLGFCILVSARVLLVHWQYYNGQLAPEFWSMLESLEEMCRRWNANRVGEAGQSTSLFSEISTRLRKLYDKCEKHPRLKSLIEGSPFDVLQEGEFDESLADDFGQGSLSISPGILGAHKQAQAPSERSSRDRRAPNMASTEANRSHVAEQRDRAQPSLGSQIEPGVQSRAEDDISALSHFLMGQPFMDMDRIISFDDMILTGMENSSATGSTNGWVAANDNLGTFAEGSLGS
ncbi:hypothetical protein GQ53DRAFT_728409 [Thozetella sp. PMI_491]|nr:hypothetical protein GQ53DRAFT_728409 [Thozetella sp. PMI_491]